VTAQAPPVYGFNAVATRRFVRFWETARFKGGSQSFEFFIRQSKQFPYRRREHIASRWNAGWTGHRQAFPSKVIEAVAKRPKGGLVVLAVDCDVAGRVLDRGRRFSQCDHGTAAEKPHQAGAVVAG
jgi:hypothetical protein